MQHFCAMLRQSPRAGRPRQYARQIENAHARKWSSPLLIGSRSGKRLASSVADAKHFDHSDSPERDPLRMNAPLVGTAQPCSAYAAFGECIFKGLSIPGCDCLRDGDGVIAAFQKRKRAFARTESAVQMNPTPIARSIERCRGLRASLKRAALISQVRKRDERCGRGAHVHLDALRTAAVRAPQVSGGHRIGGEDSRCCFTGTKSSRDDRITSGDLSRVSIWIVGASERS